MHLKITTSNGVFELHPGQLSFLHLGLEVEFFSSGEVSFPQFRIVETPDNLWINENGSQRRLVPSHYWNWHRLETLPTAFAWSNAPSEVTKKSGKKLVESGELHEMLIEFID